MIWNYALDWWTVSHLFGWFLFTSLCLRFNPRLTALIGCAILGVGWEVVEWGIIEIWLGFREPWYNRWITDPIADGLGITAAHFVRKRA